MTDTIAGAEVGPVDDRSQRVFLRREDTFIFGIRVSRLDFGERGPMGERYMDTAFLKHANVFTEFDTHEMMGCQAMDESAFQELFEDNKNDEMS